MINEMEKIVYIEVTIMYFARDKKLLNLLDDGYIY